MSEITSSVTVPRKNGAGAAPSPPDGEPSEAEMFSDSQSATIAFPAGPPAAVPSRSSTTQVLLYPSVQELTAPRGNHGQGNPAPDLSPTPAPLFGRYRRERELGRGGMGVVWLGYDEVIGIPVALKLLPEELASSAGELEGLRKEVLRGIALTHPGIVRVYGFERDARTAAIIMEYVDGKSLAELQAQQPNRCFEPEQVRPWLEQLCTALDYAHSEARIAHRDLKPRNLMLTQAGRLKVADFGIASSLNEITGGISVRMDSAGTPAYMSPQQAMGDQPTVADDIYSLGATVYDLLTGRPPFYRGNILGQALQERPETMNARRAELGVTGRAEIPPPWERAIAACLAKDSSLRPGSGAALLELLDTPIHALVPYEPRPPILLESLKLDIVPVPQRSAPEAAAESEVQVLRPVGHPWTTERSWNVEIKPRETLIAGILSSMREEAAIWIPRLIRILIIAGVGYGVFTLAGGKARWAAESAEENGLLIPMPRVVNGLPPGVPIPVITGAPSQTVIVEVHDMREGPPPGQLMPRPPPGFFPPPPQRPPPPQGGPRGPR